MLVYKITHKYSGKVYIGQTVQKLTHRLRAHFSLSQSHNNTYIKRAIQKHGKNAFTVEVVSNCINREQLNDAEMYFIEFHNCLAPNGYNNHTGGNNHIVSDETRLKQSIAHTGISTGRRREIYIPWNKGQKGLPNNGGFAKGHKSYVAHRRQPIECSNGIVYESISAAAKALNTSSGKICAVLKGKRRHTRGFTFKKVQNG